MTANGTESSAKSSKATVILGAQWGDEGKGKLVDVLCSSADLVCRCAGGNNAGHTVVVGGKTYDFHLVPSGIVHGGCTAVIGNGVVLNLPALFEEIRHNGIDNIAGWERRLILSSMAHLVFEFHLNVDAASEANCKIGTTKKGIGPTYADKYKRSGIRLADLMGDWEVFRARYTSLADFHSHPQSQMELELTKFKDLAQRLGQMNCVQDTAVYVNSALDQGKKVIVEGANGALLDIDFGTYPFVTSSNCTVGGACTGLGLPCARIGDVIGIVKAYQTRVGGGPFPTELHDSTGEQLRSLGGEYGVTTGRPRRCGWLDLVMLKRSHLFNGFTKFALTKLDVLDTFETIKVAVAYKLDGQVLEHPPASAVDLQKCEPVYECLAGWQEKTAHCRIWEELPEKARLFVQRIEVFVGVPVQWIGVGQDRAAVIERS